MRYYLLEEFLALTAVLLFIGTLLLWADILGFSIP